MATGEEVIDLIDKLEVQIVRLQAAKRRALDLADERAKEVNDLDLRLRNAGIEIDQLKQQVETLNSELRRTRNWRSRAGHP
jgi:predicted  nucleic acid-binding Zn-ribbon protein